jgi:hypothetical protein
MEVISVSGTELVAKIPDDLGVECAERSSSFRVVLLESGLEAEGGNFTIRGNTPLVLSTDPVFVEEFDDVTITGMYFAQNLFVEFNRSQIDPDTVDRQSDTSIFVNSIPSADSLGIQFDTTACTAPGNVPGSRLADTAVSVGVINLPGNCVDELPGALVYSPPPPNDCVPTPAELNTSPIDPGGIWEFPDTGAGFCSATLDLTIENIQGADATGIVITPPADEFFFVSTTCGATLSYLETCTYTMEFCPTAGIGLKSGTLTIDYFDSVSPQSINISLRGQGTGP